MSISFAVSPNVGPPKELPVIHHRKVLQQAFRRPIEALWRPAQRLVACDDDHAFVRAAKDAFYGHNPLVISPDIFWLTLAKGFAIHVNLHAEELRKHFVRHEGKEKLSITRLDFFPGADNPWPEAFDAFSGLIKERVGKLADLICCGFSTTGPAERAVSHLMVMDTFQAYFEYEMFAGCGIPRITLTGTVEDWKSIRDRAAMFGEFGLQQWVQALDPILCQLIQTAQRRPDIDFWKSFFRYRSGSGPSVMTGWINVLFPYLKLTGQLVPNPYLEDWEQRMRVDATQKQCKDPQGVGISAIPSALAVAPVKVHWGERETDMLFVGGLIGVSQHNPTLALEPQCGWVILYDSPLNSSTETQARQEEYKAGRNQQGEAMKEFLDRPGLIVMWKDD